MSISDTDRENFIRFMTRPKWTKPFRSDATIYSIETEWLKPYHKIFYVGVTQNLERRKKDHREELYNDFQETTPDSFCEGLSKKEQIIKIGPEICSRLRRAIVAACRYQGYDIELTELDTVRADEYREDTSGLSVLELMNMEAGEIKTRFTTEVYERERRWIFKKFQEGCNLTNTERIYENMIYELRYRPHLDVINSSFSSSAWDAIIKAYYKDRQLLEEYNKQGFYCWE